jgi:hypothetical protein
MAQTTNRELLQQYLADPELISEEKVDFIYKLLTTGSPNKITMLELSGYDINQTFDTAYPSPYADKIREIYPDFNNGEYIFDYSNDRIFGEMRNVCNLFAKKVIKTLCLNY